VKESLVVSACIQWLHVHGCFVWRNNTGAYKHPASNTFIRYGLVGSGDILGMTPRGRFLAVECKSEKGKPTEQQERFGGRVTEHGGLYILAHSIDDLEARRGEILG
jgi:hypothetical protein